MNSVPCPISLPEGLKNAKWPSENALYLKKVCYKVSLCESRQRQRGKAFTGLTISAKMVDGDIPFYVKIWLITDPFP